MLAQEGQSRLSLEVHALYVKDKCTCGFQTQESAMINVGYVTTKKEKKVSTFLNKWLAVGRIFKKIKEKRGVRVA